MNTSLHNHTTWSDGESMIADMAAEGERIALDELGISDHYTLFPGGAATDWSMPVNRLDAYVDEVRRAASRARWGTIRLGVEADYFPETVALLAERLQAHSFDYVIGSVHFVDGFPIDSDAARWEALRPDERDGVWEQYWRRVRQMAESRVFDIAAHLDLPKKFGFLPSTDFHALESEALDAIAAAGMSIEINTAGWYKPIEEAYPSLRLLEEARGRRIPVLVTADAHSPMDLVRDFTAGRSLARRAGYTGLVSYMEREQIVASF